MTYLSYIALLLLHPFTYCLTYVLVSSRHCLSLMLKMPALLPPLPYTLHTRYRSIAIAWTIIIIPPVFINLGLFYGLWYGTQLDRVLGLPPLLLTPHPLPLIQHMTTKLITASCSFDYTYSRTRHLHSSCNNRTDV